jgi:hypothetical protein
MAEAPRRKGRWPMTPNAQERLRRALANSDKWRKEVEAFDVMTIAMTPPLDMSMWDEEDEDLAYLWLEGKLDRIPAKINRYLVILREKERGGQ